MKRAPASACRIDADAGGNVEVPQGPGLGYEPDQAIMEQYLAA
jgi:L-alanine-DL-glutamate epimerase-like enolase superfamily enzyme